MAKDSEDARATKSRRAAASSKAKPQTQWDEPKADWIPIGPAVVRFGVTKGDSATTSEMPRVRAPLFSREAFEKFITSGKTSSLETASYEPQTPPLEWLSNLLQEKTHALQVEIEDDGRFKFVFALPGGGISVVSGTPWGILAVPDEPLEAPAKIKAEALFNKEGLVRVSEEEAKYSTQPNKAVREATGLVWRRFILPAFDRLVATGRVEIFGRAGSALTPFQQLPRDLWTILDVLDWQHGIARDPENVVYYSIHAVAGAAPQLPKQDSILADEKSATKALAQELKIKPTMRKAEALSWCRSQELRVSERRFQSHVWPDARELAGLAPKAPPGRKRKS